ncbi:MAG: hypothetical protein WDZ96_03240 [Acidimicrobiia bacterium]
MDDRERRPEGSPARMMLRRITIGLTIPLLAAAVLWWIAGSDLGLTRWISIGVIVLALAGWYFSQKRA